MTRTAFATRGKRLMAALAAATMSASCASTPPSRFPRSPRTQPAPSREPRTPASIDADLRLVGSDTTWVAHGPGYELVARSKLDIPDLETPLDDQARAFGRVFDATPTEVIVAVRHLSRDGRGPMGAAPVPSGRAKAIVEVTVTDPPPARDTSGYSGRSAGRGGFGVYGGRGGRGAGRQGGRDDGRSGGNLPGAQVEPNPSGRAIANVVRAWLSARASAVTGRLAPPSVRSGENDDARIAPWMQDGIPALLAGVPGEQQLTNQLGAHTDSLFPLRSFLTMSRPAYVRPLQSGAAGGDAGSRGGGRGGIGGRGGVGGGYPGRGGSRALPVLQGGALFQAQAALLSRYIATREGFPFLGALFDAQVQGKTSADVLRTAKVLPTDLDQVDVDWRRWLSDRAARSGY